MKGICYMNHRFKKAFVFLLTLSVLFTFAVAPASAIEPLSLSTTSSGGLSDYETYNIRPSSSTGSTKFYLNVYAGRDQDGTNVCLWSADGSAEQKWVLEPRENSYVLRPSISDTRVLDAYRPLNSGCNADIYAEGDSDAQLLTISNVSGDLYSIKLSNGLALTAGSNANNANVSWTTYSGTSKQLWYFESTSSNPYATLNWKYPFRANGADDTTANALFRGYSAGHFALDIRSYIGRPIYSISDGTVYKSGGAQIAFHGSTPSGADSRGYFVVVNSEEADPLTGNKMYIRYIHLKDAPSVYTGDAMRKGSTLIGFVGHSGAYEGYDADGNDFIHLHLDVNTLPYRQEDGGSRLTASNTINPVLFFPHMNFVSANGKNLPNAYAYESAISEKDSWQIIPGTFIDLRYIEEVGIDKYEAWADSLALGEMNLNSFCEYFKLSEEDIERIDTTYQLKPTVEIQ